MMFVAHTLGYALRCAVPTTLDTAYARDLANGGVRPLICLAQELSSGVMITPSEGNLNPVPFEDMIAPTTNWIEIRPVDINSYSYQVTRAYMIRLERADSEEVGLTHGVSIRPHMTAYKFRQRYESVAQEQWGFQ